MEKRISRMTKRMGSIDGSRKKLRNKLKSILPFLLIASLMISSVGCSGTASKPILSGSDSQIIVENVETENTITETVLSEFITSEIYLDEIVIAEEKITELLLEEEEITEVLSCRSIYVPQDNIKEFAVNSQTAQLFGEDVDISALLAKVAVGTGVIITVTILTKVGFSDPIASIVVGAADESLKFAGTGAAFGSLFGGLIGASDEIDESGRAAAVVGFALATVGLILSSLSLIAVVPSGGSTTITAAAGAKLIIAGISVLTATAGTTQAGYQAVKSFTSTDAREIDWSNIDWQKVGVSSAEKAIKNAADGYMWGSVIGAVHGGIEGYDFYQKYNAPYTPKDVRSKHTPINDGSWSGERGNSDFILDKPIELPNGMKITKISYRNGVPDFSPCQKAQVKISGMTNNRYDNFKKADEALANYWSKIKHEGRTWNLQDIKTYRTDNNFSWHEMSNMESMQLVPRDVHETFIHWGGVSEYNAMIGQIGGAVFD